MKEILVTPLAVADLAEIRRYTRRTWGAAQARDYLSGLGTCFESIAGGEAATRDVEGVGCGYRRCRYRSHVVIFAEGPNFVRIVRVLHVRMDQALRLGGD